MCPDWQQREISIHSLHTEGDDTEKTQAQINSISIHSLHTEGDNNRSFKNLIIINFNPLPPHGGRLGFHCFSPPRCYFNPLPPHGGRRAPSVCSFTWLIFQSTPSTRRETQLEVKVEQDRPISIHSLHTEGDPAGSQGRTGQTKFNPLPPHGGRRYAMVSGADSSSFQSTPSTRRETVTPFSSVSSLLDFNPLPPHGGRLCVVLVFPPDCTFQSTPSTRRETQRADKLREVYRISIHSLHTEGDETYHSVTDAVAKFQSTPSTRRETHGVGRHLRVICISIHSLHTEGDGV